MMKSKSFWGAILLTWASELFGFAQTSPPVIGGAEPPATERGKAFAVSQVLAVRLYPAAADANSPLIHEIEKLDKTAETFGLGIANDPYKPLLYCIMAASVLGIESDWDKLTDKEKSDVFHEIVASLQASDTEYSATNIASIRGPTEPVPDVNAQIIKKQSEEIADLKLTIWEQKNYIQGLYNDDLAAKNALGQAQFMAWQAWQMQNQNSQQRSFSVQDSNGNSSQVIVTPNN